MEDKKNKNIDFALFERVIAYKAMTDSTYLMTIADHVKPEYFEDSNISSYFEIVKDFYEKRHVLPTITEVKTYLTNDILKKNFKKLVESFKDLDSKLDLDELYENTENFLKQRATLCVLSDIGENLEHKTKNPDEVLVDFESIVGLSLQTDTGFELYRDSEKMFHDIENEESYISTGWEWLDNALGGGFRKYGKALYMFAGQANIGKSIFLGNIAAAIAEQDKTVLVISLEMSELMYAQRISSNITKIPMKDFIHEIPSLRHSLYENKKKLPKAKIFIKEFPPSTLTTAQLIAFIKKLVASGEHLDAIIIDYLGLMHSTVGANSYERLKYVCEQVRAMSYPKFFGCPVVSAAQLSRCLDLETKVIGPSGELRMGDLTVGDEIMGSSGFVTVRYIYPVEQKKTFKITTKSGREIICSEDHLFPSQRGMISLSDGLTVGDSLFSATHI